MSAPINRGNAPAHSGRGGKKAREKGRGIGGVVGGVAEGYSRAAACGETPASMCRMRSVFERSDPFHDSRGKERKWEE